MTLDEIKRAVDAGLTVNWKNQWYEVLDWGPTPKTGHVQHLCIVCTSNGHGIGLTHMDGVTMNGDEADFFIRTTPKGPLE